VGRRWRTVLRRLPMVRVEKDYRFEGPHGVVALAALFGDHDQLVAQRLMFDRGWDTYTCCSGCTAALDDGGDRFLRHLACRRRAYVLVSRASLAKLGSCGPTKRWTIPWYLSFGSEFNDDFHVSFDHAAAPAVFNCRNAEELQALGVGWTAEQPNEQSRISTFFRPTDAIFHTYSTSGRGCEALLPSCGVMDMTARGRDREELKGG
jgi:predicted dithiol-disulfide oxidoreductase (DUF899 family)